LDAPPTLPSFVRLPKSANAEHIEENADVFGFELSKDEMEALDALQSDTWNPVKAP
jgi:diketogulonate reductase-like aldo/keto reductase